MRRIRSATPSKETKLANKQRFISLDLLYAVPPDADTCHYLMDNGLTREEYDWFMAGEPPGYQIMGNDYYGRNERILKPDGTVVPAEDVLGWYQITKEYHGRYKKPVMHTETNTFDAEAAPSWLWKQWMPDPSAASCRRREAARLSERRRSRAVGHRSVRFSDV